MINFKDFLEEKRGLWDNLHDKQKRIKNGSGEHMRKPGSKGAPTAADFKAANEEVVAEALTYPQKHSSWSVRSPKKNEFNTRYKLDQEPEARAHAERIGGKLVKVDQRGHAIRTGSKGDKHVVEELSADEQFDLIEDVVMDLAELHNLDPELVWEQFEEIEDEKLYEYAIDKKGYKSSTGGLTQKGVDAYNRKTGGHLKTAVTTKPSKLKPGSKAANRRKSFCARMGGMPGAMKDDKGRPTRKALALRKWNC